MIRHSLDRLAAVLTVLLAALLFWAPLPFASVTPWATTILVVALFACLPLALLVVRADIGRQRVLRDLALPAATLGAIGGVGLAQSRLWPRGLVGWVSGEHVEILSALGGLLPEDSVTAESAVSLSLAPSVSAVTALLWLALAAALLEGGVVGQRRVRRLVLGGTVVAAALFQVIYGGQAWFQRATTIWTVEVPGDAGRLRGTFVNSDHLALYLEISLALVFAWGWWALRRARRETLLEQRLVLVVPPLLIWLTLFVSIAFTGSRAGLLAAVVATAAQGIMVVLTSRSSGIARRLRWAPSGVAAGVMGISVVAYLGLQQGLGRWLGTSAYELTWNERLEVYRASVELWQRFPWFGSGLGTFREAFPLVQPAGMAATWTHAHNDYLELLVTVGLLGAVLLGIGLAVLGARLVRVLRFGVASEDRAAGMAGLGALLVVGIHSALDFGLTMPANSVTLAVLCGAAAAAHSRHGDGGSQDETASK